MARKSNLKFTPLMSLSLFAMFALMIPVFTVANSQNKTTTSRAAEVTPAPSPETVMYK